MEPIVSMLITIGEDQAKQVPPPVDVMSFCDRMILKDERLERTGYRDQEKHDGYSRKQDSKIVNCL